MKILVACEESQAVCIAMRRKGHIAFSCDIEPCSGGHPEWHICQDVLPLLDGDCNFMTVDGCYHSIQGEWDMIIAFPPCTDLAISGTKWFLKKRQDGSQRQSIEFFCRFFYAKCQKIVIENPIGIISGGAYIKRHFPDLAAKYQLPRKYSQIIQPYEFGHGETKATCLWLKNVDLLHPTNIVKEREGKIVRMPPSPDRKKMRSKTYTGVANAMAEQWG